MAKAIAATAADRFSRYLHNLDFSGPLFTGGALAVFKRFGPVGLIAAGLGGYALKRHLDSRNGSPMHANDDAPAPKKARKASKPKAKKKH